VIANILDTSRPTQAFAVNFSGYSRNAHIFFSGPTGLKYSSQKGGFVTNDEARYGIVLKLENNELFPLNVTVKTYISTDMPIGMQAPEDFEKYNNLSAFSYSDSVSALDSSNIPLFFGERAIPDLINKLIRKGQEFHYGPLSFYAVSRVEIGSRKDVSLSDIYYINSHIYATTETVSMGGLDVLVPTVFGEGVSINSAVSVDRRLDKDDVAIDRHYDLLAYSCQVVGSQYELLLVSPAVLHNVPKDEANNFMSGKKVGRINTDCLYVIQELEKLKIDKAKSSIQFLMHGPSASIIRVN